MKTLTLERTASDVRSDSVDKGFVVFLTSAALVGMLYVLAQNNLGFQYLLSNGLPPILAFAAFAMGTAGLIRNGVNMKNRVSTIWLGYTLGVLLWLLGESTWAVYALGYSNPNPFPSLADVFWLAGYIPLLCAMMMQSWPFREFFSSRKMTTVMSTTIVLAGILLATLIPSTYASGVGQDFVSIVLSLAYPLLDVALLIVAIPVMFLFGRGTFWRPFLFITVGLILSFAADILFSWATLNGINWNGTYFELAFHWSYLALAYGFYLRFRSGTGAAMLG